MSCIVGRLHWPFLNAIFNKPNVLLSDDRPSFVMCLQSTSVSSRVVAFGTSQYLGDCTATNSEFMFSAVNKNRKKPVQKKVVSISAFKQGNHNLAHEDPTS